MLIGKVYLPKRGIHYIHLVRGKYSLATSIEPSGTGTHFTLDSLLAKYRLTRKDVRIA
jgi:hypothetical protein